MEDEQKRQIEGLMAAAEMAGAAVQQARRSYEELRANALMLLGQYGVGKDGSSLLSSQFEAAFSLGHQAGENSQGVMMAKEQMDVLVKSMKHVEERDARDEERHARDEERSERREKRDEEHLELSRKSSEALSDIAKVVCKQGFTG